MYAERDTTYLANTADLDTDDPQSEADARFIALANPATILALCKRIREPAKVKPLSWRGSNVADCPFGEYSTERDEDDEVAATPWCAWSPAEDGTSLGHYATVAEAEAACQADYASRIRSALITETDNG